MDIVERVPEVQRSFRNGQAVPSYVAQHELRILNIESLEHVELICAKYEALNVPKLNKDIFKRTLMFDPNAWFLELGNIGLMYLVQLVPGINAQMHLVFWDEKLPATRAPLVRKAVKFGMERFELPRISAQFKWSAVTMKHFLRKVGFVYEGTLRKGWIDETGYQDMLLYGMISEEL